MRSMICGLLIPAAMLLAGCAASSGEGQSPKGGQKVAETPQGTPAPTAAPRAYSKNLDELRAAFNRDKGRVRLVTLLSPTWPACVVRGASEVTKVLDRVKDPEVRVYVVWVPSLPADKEDRVPAATAKIADARASHFWDETGSLKAAYQRALKMEELAWDVYYLYAGDAEWKGDPPVPAYFQHQLHSLPPDRMLDADKLAAELNRLLRQSK